MFRILQWKEECTETTASRRPRRRKNDRSRSNGFGFASAADRSRSRSASDRTACQPGRADVMADRSEVRSAVRASKVACQVRGYSMMAPPHFALRHATQMGLQPAATSGLIVSQPFSSRLWRLLRLIATIQDHSFERPSRRRNPRYNGIYTIEETDYAIHQVASAVRANPPSSDGASHRKRGRESSPRNGTGTAERRVCDGRLVHAAPRYTGGRKKYVP